MSCNDGAGDSVRVAEFVNGPAQLTVNAVAVEVVAARDGRLGGFIQNVGSVDVWLGVDNTVTALTGFKLPSDGCPAAHFRQGNVVYGGAMWAIGAGAGARLAYVEE